MREDNIQHRAAEYLVLAESMITTGQELLEEMDEDPEWYLAQFRNSLPDWVQDVSSPGASVSPNFHEESSRRHLLHALSTSRVGSHDMIWVIIPTLNEELALPTTLTSLFQQSGTYQVVAVDGGSTDQTWALVNADPRITPLMAAKGRASQMNAGAQYAWTHCQLTNDWLLFLHADTRLPDGALQRLNHLESEETCQA